MSVIINQADLTNPLHAQAIVDIVDAYACEPQGGGQRLSEAIKARIVPTIQSLPTGFALLAWIDDQPVGVAVCFRGFSTFAGAQLINVHDLSVRAGYRSQGIGSALLAAVENLARETGCYKVTLEVRDANPQAEALYRRLGYVDPSGFPTKSLDKPVA